jgi:predicted transcriptional regulator
MRKKRTEIDMLAAAYLAREGDKQTAIAEMLGLSQAVVSRMLAKAKDIYWREHVQFIAENVSSEEKMQILDRIGRNDLARRLTSVGAARGPAGTTRAHLRSR